MRLACCQIAPEVGNPEGSAARACAALAAAIDAGADIVVLPELASSGYVFSSDAEVQAAATPADGQLLADWARQAARADALVIGGFCELAGDGRIFNSTALVDGDGVRAVYRKLHLWGEESRWFVPGDQPAPVIETSLGRIGLGICYDIEFPELTRGLALAGADLIALPTNWPREEHSFPILRSLAQTTAYLSHVFVAVCDRAGSERGLDFEGGSTIAAADGTLLAVSAPGAVEETLTAEFDLAVARNKQNGPYNDSLADRRPQHYMSGLSLSGRPDVGRPAA